MLNISIIVFLVTLILWYLLKKRKTDISVAIKAFPAGLYFFIFILGLLSFICNIYFVYHQNNPYLLYIGYGIAALIVFSLQAFFVRTSSVPIMQKNFPANILYSIGSAGIGILIFFAFIYFCAPLGSGFFIAFAVLIGLAGSLWGLGFFVIFSLWSFCLRNYDAVKAFKEKSKEKIFIFFLSLLLFALILYVIYLVLFSGK